MGVWTWVSIIVVSIAVSIIAVVVIGKALLQRIQVPTLLEGADVPCYRCGVEASTEYMGLHYCMMCRIVVVQTIGAVRHDPPFGFPGSPGYLEFPKIGPIEEKKET